MSLEFAKVVDDVGRMARHLGYRVSENSSRLERALALLYACDLEEAYDRIDLIRRSGVSGYRGAAPAPRPRPPRISPVRPKIGKYTRTDANVTGLLPVSVLHCGQV